MTESSKRGGKNLESDVTSLLAEETDVHVREQLWNVSPGRAPCTAHVGTERTTTPRLAEKGQLRVHITLRQTGQKKVLLRRARSSSKQASFANNDVRDVQGH